MKTQIKKTVSVIMAVLMLVALVPLNNLGVTAQAAKSGNFKYSVSGGKATVTGLVNKNVASVIIPDTLGGYPVTCIGESAFNWCDKLESVTIPDSVTSIEDYAFSSCYNLASVNIPQNVTNIGYSAFSGCKITSVSLSEKVTSIGTFAFDCDTLIKITVSPDNKVYSSEDGVLFNKDKTTLIQYPASNPETEYTVPDSVTLFDSPSFDDCKYLETVNLPRNLWLMYNRFSNAVSLTDINVDPNNDSLSSIDGILFSKDGDELITYPMGRQDIEYTIPDEVTQIGNYAFQGDGKLQKINIGKGLTEIGYCFFARCNSLKEINIPDNVTKIGYAAFELCKNLKTVTIPNTVTIIDDSAFRNCYSLQKIEIPASVTYIGSEAFCFADLTEITILNPNCVIYDSYDTLEYPETIIGYEGSTAEAYAKEYKIDFIALCTHDETYHISSDEVPATCTADGLTAGVYCSKCDRWISGHEVIWAHHTDEDGDKICDICKEDAPIIVAIGTCGVGKNLESDLVWRLDENGKFTVTGSDAMVNYSMSDTEYRPWSDYIDRIKTVDIGDGVTIIGSGAFKNCFNLTSVKISQSVTRIGQSAFESCTSLSDITIPQSMKSIDYYAFRNCTSLKSITIPKSVTFIGDYAFGYCYSSGKYTSIDGFTIYGPTDSAAETYAETNGFAFVEKICTHNKSTYISYDEVPATCKTGGYTAGKYCDECKEWIEGHSFIEAHHTDADGDDICDVCGEATAITIKSGETKTINVEKGETVYIAFTPKVSGTYSFTSYSDCDTYGYLFDSNKNMITENDDDYDGDDGNFKITYHLEKGKKYYFGAESGESGSFEVTLTCDDIECDHTNTSSFDEVPATCTENGFTAGVFCNDCETWTSGHETVNSHHTYGDWKTTSKATCTKAGSKQRTCSVCKAVDTRTIKALGHSYSSKWTVDKKATCTKTGSKSHHCTRCNAKKDITTIEATGHSYKTTTVKATTSKSGSKTTKCTVCGKVKSKSTIAKISSVALSSTSYTYNGKTKKPTVTVKDSKGNKLNNGTDYTVKYSSGRKNVGKYTVTVTFKGNYSGAKKLTFEINPKGTSISKLTAGKKKFTATLAKQTTQTSGYQLQYSTSSNMKNATTKTYSDASKTSKSVTGLKSGTKYYVRVRTYKNVKIDGKTVKLYSSWSSIGSVKTK